MVNELYGFLRKTESGSNLYKLNKWICTNVARVSFFTGWSLLVGRLSVY